MNASHPSPPVKPGQAPGGPSRVVWVLGLLAAGFVVVAGLRWQAARTEDSARQTSTPSPGAEVVSDDSPGANPAGALSQVFRRNAGPTAEEAAASGAATPVAVAAPPAARPPLTAEGREALRLLNVLAAASRNGTAAEQAAMWQQTMNAVVALGPAGISGIREFLDAKVDAQPPAGLAGTNIFPGSLRSQMIDTLLRLGGTEAADALAGALSTSMGPDELAHMARNLATLAPGRYQAEIVRAATDSLNQNASAGPAGAQMAPVFQLLQAYGDASVIPELTRYHKQWPYYSTIALAGLPDGQGVSELTRIALDTSPGSGGATRIAMEALAQLAPGNPGAEAALLELAKANRISAVAWANLAPRLAGDELVMGTPPDDYSNRRLTTWRIAAGNQNYYATANRTGWQGADYDRRRQLIDRLLSIYPAGDAQRHLQTARDSLAVPPR